MKSMIRAVLAVCAFAVCASGAATAQERIFRPPGGGQARAEIVFYAQPNYRGPAVRVQAPVTNIELGWRIRSVRVVRGEWQTCARANYGGPCTIIRDSTPMLPAVGPAASVRSLRPVNATPEPPEPPTPPTGNAGPSMRGMASEFYRAPAVRGQRILACRRGNATANCARTTAEQFCRARGYAHLGNVAMETASGRVYLADVLCRRSPG